MGSVNIIQLNTCTNDTVIVRATANPGYCFLKWNDGNTDTLRTIPLTSDTVLTAIFDILYTVTAAENNSQYGHVSGGGTYPKDSTAIITATPNTGYRFVYWNDGNADNPRLITVVSDTSLTAIFTLDAVGTYYVLVKVNNPIMGSVTGGGDYPENTPATITAIPNSGYRFVQWTGGDKTNPRTVTITQDTIFTAEFEAALSYRVTLSVNVPIMGRVTGEGEYAENTAATITAIPYPGYRFGQWNDGDKTNPRTVTVTQDTTFTALFVSETGITNIETSTINIYPNPATDNIHITLPENVSHAIFTLYDMQGKVLIQQQINSQDAVSVNKLAAWIYIYSVRTEKENHTGKIIRK
jgi:hypothetical protein